MVGKVIKVRSHGLKMIGKSFKDKKVPEYVSYTCRKYVSGTAFVRFDTTLENCRLEDRFSVMCRNFPAQGTLSRTIYSIMCRNFPAQDTLNKKIYSVIEFSAQGTLNMKIYSIMCRNFPAQGTRSKKDLQYNV